MYNTQYWRCTFTGVVLVSNCNRSRCFFSSYGCLQFQRNFATSKRIYICTNRMVCVCVERTVMCCDVWCELRCRVVMKNENKWEYWAEDAKMKLNSTVCPSFSLVAPFFLTVCFPSYSFLSFFLCFRSMYPYKSLQLIGNSLSRASTHTHSQSVIMMFFFNADIEYGALSLDLYTHTHSVRQRETNTFG